MRLRWTIPLATIFSMSGLVIASSLLGQTRSPVVGEPVGKIDPSVPVEVGGKPPFSPDPQAEQVLRANGIEFSVPSTPPPDLPIAADKAVAMANKILAPGLTRQPNKITVEFVNYTNARERLQNKKVWKITYWGAPIRLNGPGPNEDGSLPQIKQPTSQKATTWILVDSTSGEPITSFSSGPVSD